MCLDCIKAFMQSFIAASMVHDYGIYAIGVLIDYVYEGDNMLQKC